MERLQTNHKNSSETRRIQLAAGLILASMLLASCAAGPLPFRESSLHSGKLTVTETDCPVWKELLGPPQNHGANGTAIQYRCRFVDEEPEEIIEVAAVVETPAPPEIVLDGVEFAFDSSALRPSAQETLRKDIEILKQNLEGNIQIDGYTDSTGTAKYNMGLSIRRAESVKNFLVQNGIAANRIGISGHGEEDPIATNKTSAGRAKNRRVTIRLD